jgi:M6 family metalloprotease-like protein
LAVPLAAAAGTASAQNSGALGASGPIVPVDQQNLVDQEDMVREDYVQIRPDAWNDDSNHGSEEQFEAAVILIDYEDMPFLVSQESGAHPFGNPAPEGSPWHGSWEPVEDVRAWFQEYYTVPNEFNNYQSIHSYWMENSFGRVGVTVDVFGPYTMDGNAHEWGLSHGPVGFRQLGDEPDSVCPAGDNCTPWSLNNPDGRDIRRDGNAPWRAEMEAAGHDCPTATIRDLADCGYDFLLYAAAGPDESSAWQEFGEMMFRTHLDIPDAFGPPGAEDGPVLNSAGNPIPNYVSTRYFGDAGIRPEDGGFTSWRAGAGQWSNAQGGLRPSSTQSEASGQSTFAHEISHLFGLPDNYNNPFSDHARNYSGYWEMMSRGTFNGPGGTHNRWQIPAEAGSLGPHHMLHFKTSGPGSRLDFVLDDEHVQINRNDLVDDGVAVTSVKARAHTPNGDNVGLTVSLGDGGFSHGACLERVEVDPNWWCHTSVSNWQEFTMEVVDRVGNDSFTPGHGVLLAQTRSAGTPRIWVVDAVPEDIDRIDFFRPGNDEEPGGEPVPVLRGDPRQLDDATFHAGTLSDSEFEYLDEPNNLHFYILDAYRDADDALFYDVAVRNTTGAGDFDRDVSLGTAATYPAGASTAVVTLPLTNTGTAGDGIYGSDVYRLSASVDEPGWDVHLPYEVVAAEAGETVPVAVYATADSDATESATVTIVATSESDPDATVTVAVELSAADLKVTFTSASALVEAYFADGLLDRSEYQRLRAQLNVAERTSGRAAHMALDRFVAIAEDLADIGARNLASAALVSVAGDLRDEL